ncbi:MAG: hypothetical protein CVU38_14470 [Chloroflexi bacterium HGW-Chloroflexi-1]|nr:MAG: hypothetical protein CVU38_14470 [Chloroflexi bacterium HGW-Chloroflexi-1]
MSTCFYCGGDLTERQTTFVYEEAGEVRIVRNVPALVCTQCGEKEYTQDTTHQVLSLLRQPPRPKELLQIPAYELVAA